MRTYGLFNNQHKYFFAEYHYDTYEDLRGYSEVRTFDTIEDAREALETLISVGLISEGEFSVLEYTKQESKTFVIVDKEDGQLLTDDDGDIIKYGSRLWAEGYVRSRGWEDEVIIIDITKLIK